MRHPHRHRSFEEKQQNLSLCTSRTVAMQLQSTRHSQSIVALVINKERGAKKSLLVSSTINLLLASPLFSVTFGYYSINHTINTCNWVRRTIEQYVFLFKRPFFFLDSTECACACTVRWYSAGRITFLVEESWNWITNVIMLECVSSFPSTTHQIEQCRSNRFLPVNFAPLNCVSSLKKRKSIADDRLSVLKWLRVTLSDRFALIKLLYLSPVKTHKKSRSLSWLKKK